jgi:hypothetical protein
LTKQEQNVGFRAAGAIGTAGAPNLAIEITPKMIEAGVYAAREHCLGESLDELVRKVFLAMAVETLN